MREGQIFGIQKRGYIMIKSILTLIFTDCKADFGEGRPKKKGL